MLLGVPLAGGLLARFERPLPLPLPLAVVLLIASAIVLGRRTRA